MKKQLFADILDKENRVTDSVERLAIKRAAKVLHVNGKNISEINMRTRTSVVGRMKLITT